MTADDLNNPHGSKLEYIEIEPSTPEKSDNGLKFSRFVPRFIAEKAMRRSLAGLRLPLRSVSPDDAGVTETKHIVDGYGGKIEARLYMPQTDKPCPLTVHFHGGAFIGGNPGRVSDFCKAYAARMNEAVLAPSYSLAPEYPFPRGPEDCYRACVWACENARELGLNTEKLTLSGDSAGGNFAAALTLMAADRGGFKACGLILYYPYVSFANPRLPMTKVMHKWYLNGADPLNPYVSPLETDLSGFPPTLTAVCEYDLLTENGKAFAEKLSASGIDSTLVLFKRTRHAFIDNSDTLKQSGELLDVIEKWKKRLKIIH